MKFILGFVAITLISLTIYVYMESNGKQQVQKEINKVEQSKEKVFEIVSTKDISKKVTHTKVDTSTNEEASVKEVISSIENSIEIYDDELATNEEYYPDINQTSDEPISDKELYAIEKDMIESGQISQEGDFSASTENLGYDPSELAGKI